MHSLASAICIAFLVATYGGQQPSPPPTADARDAHASGSTCDDLVRRAADLVRRSRFGSEAFGAAERELTQLYDAHRGCEVAPLLAALLDGMHEQDAARQLCIAMFYVRNRGDDVAAENRLQRIVDAYP